MAPVLVSGTRRRVLGRLLRLRTGRRQLTDDSLLSLLPESALVPLQRDRLDPVEDLGRIREREPVSRLKLPFGVRGWLVTGYDESQGRARRRPARFSNDFRHLVGTAGIGTGHHPGGLGFADPPEHTRLRQLLTPEFTDAPAEPAGAPDRRHRRPASWTRWPSCAERDGAVDLLEHFAMPIPSLTICELLGIPYEDRHDFQRLSTARFDFLGGAGGTFGAISESLGYLLEVVKAAARRARAEGCWGC